MNHRIKPVFPKRLYSLDVVRGIAALSIVAFHWMHFFFRGTHPDPNIPVASLPFYPTLFIIYHGGDMVVDLFFVLSGFVFYWLYSQKVINRSVGAWSFSVLRFSRLYPLHLATLLLVLLLQILYKKQTGSAFVYPHNDSYHFGLQLAFVSQWGFQSGHSFNGPIWSVSVEILLYSIFFFACAHRWGRASHAAAFGLCGLVIQSLNGPVGRGMFAFFTGGLTFFLARFLLARGTGKTTMRVLVALCVVAWIATAMSVKLSFFAHLTAWLQQMQLFGLSDRMIASLCSHASNKAIVGALFPLTILSLVLVEAQRGSCGKRIAFLGHVSYSSYLLHFPLQLFIVTMFAHLNWSITVFQQGWSLVAFYSVLIPLSILVFRFYESPAQAILRRLLLPKRPQDCLNGTHSERPVWEGH